MENMINALGSKKFLVKVYGDNLETLYEEKELSYFELAVFILTQEYYVIKIKKAD